MRIIAVAIGFNYFSQLVLNFIGFYKLLGTICIKWLFYHSYGAKLVKICRKRFYNFTLFFVKNDTTPHFCKKEED